MSHDISKSVPQGSYRTQDAEDNRIAAIADELSDFAQYMKRNVEIASKM